MTSRTLPPALSTPLNWAKRQLERIPDLSLRWPSRCWVCGSWPTAPVCEDCVTAFAQPRTRCRQCALAGPITPIARTPHGSTSTYEEARVTGPDPTDREGRCAACQGIASPLTACHAALDYDYPWDRCIATFKYSQQPGMARMLARLMWHAPGIAPVLEQAERVVPMPLSRERLHQRGYNQAHELARALVSHLPRDWHRMVHGARYTPHILHRVRDTQAQSTLDASDRQTNLHQALVVLPADHARVQGQRVVVIDDIMTTGASLREAARALLQAGAHSVTGVVLARTPTVS